ncbi:Uncharacterised protein [Chryseobacterium nakagawai]|uniref:Uncharacterized protein n=1 Tax=Chryseobacterium nakagawai TaxID=1241982 RepID=A0AAD0YMN6_CHRNA|nr:hypothetical protein [Chryseobacterium nakagawai]AZA92662.1 hypothetical protein EG343_19725 [Chryseobacterium nakagawai]VEH19262.1 Uncharacterised protein [Chryseobacterium nakagawai]
MKTFKKQHSALKRNEMKTILGGIKPPKCDPANCMDSCIAIGFERGVCDSTGLCSCGPFTINQ